MCGLLCSFFYINYFAQVNEWKKNFLRNRKMFKKFKYKKIKYLKYTKKLSRRIFQICIIKGTQVTFGENTLEGLKSELWVIFEYWYHLLFHCISKYRISYCFCILAISCLLHYCLLSFLLLIKMKMILSTVAIVGCLPSWPKL